MSIPIPPINSLTNWLDFKSAINEPTISILLNSKSEFSLTNEYGINKITAMIICKSNNDEKHFAQLLKKPFVETFERQRIANGESRIRTLISMYLKAKLIISANDEMERILDNIPSMENTSIEDILVFITIDVNEEKDISSPKTFLPSNKKKELIVSVLTTIKLQIEKEWFMATPDKNACIKNLYGGSTFTPR